MIKPPTIADTLRKNPLGLYVDAIDWSRELEPGADRAVVAAASSAAARPRSPSTAPNPNPEIQP